MCGRYASFLPREAIARFCDLEGVTAGPEYVEVETGKGSDALERRPQLAAALARAKRLGCPIVVSKLDRLSRDADFDAAFVTHCRHGGLQAFGWHQSHPPNCLVQRQ